MLQNVRKEKIESTHDPNRISKYSCFENIEKLRLNVLILKYGMPKKWKVFRWKSWVGQKEILQKQNVTRQT